MKKIMLTLFICIFCSPALGQEMSCESMNFSDSYDKNKSGFLYLVPGKDGFIFRSKADFKRDFLLNRNTATSISRMVRILKDRGTDFVMVVQPTRGIMARNFIDYSNKHATSFMGDTALENYKNLIKHLKTLGVITADLTNGPQGPDYFSRRDIHWTQTGADFSAKAIWDEMNKSGILNGIAKEQFVTVEGKKGTYKGGLAEATDKICGIKLPEESFVQHETTKENQDNNDILFSDDTPKIVLAGTSNSTIQRANFEGALKQYMSADILNVSVAGGGPDTALLDYLSSEEYKKTPPKILIWEVPAHYQINSKALYSKILPAIAGACKNPVLKKDIIISGPTDIIVDIPRSQISGGQGYAHITIQGQVPKSLRGNAIYGDKKSYTVELVTSARMKRHEFFMDFDIRSNMLPDKLTFDAPSKTAAHIELCSY